MDPQEVGSRVGGVPWQQARAQVGWRGAVGGGATVSTALALRWDSSRFADNTNRYRLSSNALLDAHLRLARDNWWVQVSGTNLTDRQYYSQVFVQSAFAPGLGQASWGRSRALLLQLGVQF